MTRLLPVLSVVMLAAGFVCIVGCSPNAAATEKCKAQIHGAGDCASCRKRNGASGHKYLTGSSCSCLN